MYNNLSQLELDNYLMFRTYCSLTLKKYINYILKI